MEVRRLVTGLREGAPPNSRLSLSLFTVELEALVLPLVLYIQDNADIILSPCFKGAFNVLPTAATYYNQRRINASESVRTYFSPVGGFLG